jgi:hypothetical protein
MARPWRVKPWHDASGTDRRIYVQMWDGREGCLYLSGNLWYPRGHRAGDLTSAEWEAARAASVRDDMWYPVYTYCEYCGRIAVSLGFFGEPVCQDCGGSHARGA